VIPQSGTACDDETTKEVMRTKKVYIDGQFYDEEHAKVSVFDHGLVYGDGIFEGVRIYNGRVFMLREHLERLYASAQTVMLKIPVPIDEFEKIILETCRLNEAREGYIRPMVTRGVGNLGVNPTSCPKASIIVIVTTITIYPAEYYEKGLKVVTAATQRMSYTQVPPAVKSLSYMNNMLARLESNLCGAQEALMLNAQGYVAECTGDNVFSVKDGEIFTPPISAGALGGITRACVMKLAGEMGKTVREENLTRHDLFTADEMFLTGTGAEVAPVRELDGRTIGKSCPGPITGEIMKRFKEFARNSGTPIYK
jgi:branched-chain amino acid aminotransferase